MSTNQKELLEKHEEWQDTIEVKPKIKTNIKMRVTLEQSEKVQEICFKNGIDWISKKRNVQFTDNPFLFIDEYISLMNEDEDEDFLEEENEEIGPELFIRTNGTCIEKEEFTYPMWFKSIENKQIVRFDSLIQGDVVYGSQLYDIGYTSKKWTPHTNTEVWEQVEEPKEIKQENSINNGGSTDYYKLPKNVKDLQDLIEYKDMNFALGNIFKAVYRLGNCSHSNAIRDLNKIVYFANRELERLKKVNNAS